MQEDIALALKRPPFSSQLGAAERQREQERLVADLRTAANSPTALRQAAQAYADALERTPDDPELRREFARLLDRHGNVDAAGQQWLALVQRFPYVAEWRLECGQFLLNHGKLSAAIAEFRETARIDPWLAGPAHVGIANAAVQGGNPAEAERVLREALACGSHPVMVHNAFGMLLFQQERWEEARQHFREVLRIDPDQATPHANLAVLFTKQRNVPEAVRHCRELLRLEPGDSGGGLDHGGDLPTNGIQAACIPRLAGSGVRRSGSV